MPTIHPSIISRNLSCTKVWEGSASPSGHCVGGGGGSHRVAYRDVQLAHIHTSRQQTLYSNWTA